MAAQRQFAIACHGHTRPVVDVDFSEKTPDGIFMISACKDGKPMLRNGVNGDWVGTFVGHKGAVWSSKLNKQATRAVTGSGDFTAKLWDATNGNDLLTLEHNHVVKTVCFNEDNKKILTGSNEKLIRLYDLEKPESPDVLPKLNKPACMVLFGKDDSQAFSGGEDGFIRMWDLRTFTQVREVNVGNPISEVHLSQDQSYLIVAGGKKIYFYNPETLEKIKEITGEYQLYSGSLHPDKSRVVVAGEDNYIHVYDFETLEKVETHKGHHGFIHRVRHSPDGMVYASGSEDSSVRLWQHQMGVNYGLWKWN